MNEPKIMRALAVTDVKRLDRLQIDVPMLLDDEVLVKVAWCGICGSDVPRYFEGAVHSFPQILGHEFSGTVVSKGRSASGIALGDRVVVAPLVPCGTCGDCERGYPALCGNYSFIGSRRQGALAEYVAVPAVNALKLPENINLREAALIEPLTVAIHGVRRADLKLGDTAIVMGSGVIGIMVAMVLRSYGINTGLIEIDGRKRIFARGLGFTCADSYEKVSKELGPVDCVFETAGASATQAQALDIARRQGQVIYVGTAHRDVVYTPSQFERILRGELRVTGSWMSYSSPFPGREWTLALQLVGGGQIDAEELVTSTYPLEAGEQAFEAMIDRDALRLKVLFSIGGEL